MKVCMTALFLGVACFLFQAGAAEPTEAERKRFLETKVKAEKGDAKAQTLLGAFYQLGAGVPKDDAEAVKWYRKAADQGCADAQSSLGNMYAWGTAEGVVKDAEAVKWSRKAADQGYADAQHNLGRHYLAGEGVPKDDAEAVKWFRKAADQGNAPAQLALSYMFANGLGAAQSYVEAYKWFVLAAAQGDETTTHKLWLLRLHLDMTPEQIAKGKALARDFKPRVLPPAGGDSSRLSIAQSRHKSSGTGFFITEDGYFITNHHVAGEGAQVRLVTANGNGFVVAKVVKVDVLNDLALLKAEGKFAALPVITSRGVRLGSTAATVGFPKPDLQGFAPKLTKGEVSSLAGVQDDARRFQISVPVQPGNSGGALVDERGNVIGVVVATFRDLQNVNYAVKSSYLLSFLESVPEVAAKLKDAHTKERKFEDVVKSVEQATVLVLVY